MAYTNSPLAVYTKLSPNHSGQRTHAIDRISPHCVVGQCNIETLGEWFSRASTQASSNYGIGRDGKIGLFVPESCRSFCTSSAQNDQRAVTIECASDTTDPYRMTDEVYQSLITLCADICRRNGKRKLLWIDDKTKALAYEPKSDEMLITVHRWFANKSCPGDWLYGRLGDLAAKVTALLQPASIHYRAHVQTYGWLDAVADGVTSGTTGEGKRLEAIKVTPPDGWELEVAVHLQGIGDKVYKGIKKGKSSGLGSSATDPIIGTVGEGRRMEAIRIHAVKKTGGKQLKYRVHMQGIGWGPWCTDNQWAGTKGEARRIEAIQIKIV